MYAGRLGITLFVRDVQRSVDFYQRVLGFSFKGYWNPAERRVVEEWSGPEGPPYAEVIAGENRIGLRSVEPGSAPRGAEYLLQAVDLDLLHRRVKGNGGAANEPKVQPWGARTFTVRDPDGHAWVVMQSKSG